MKSVELERLDVGRHHILRVSREPETVEVGSAISRLIVTRMRRQQQQWSVFMSSRLSRKNVV